MPPISFRLFLFIIFLYILYRNHTDKPRHRSLTSEPDHQAPTLPVSPGPLRPHRIVAVADVHGDYENTIAVLKMSGVVDDDEHWAGGDHTTFVQTGDVVDRGPDTIQLYSLLARLTTEAQTAGGMVIALNGNHEYMNLRGDWRFVHPGDISSFGNVSARVVAFKPDGFIGAWLYPRNMTALVNGTVFCHGGIHPTFAKMGLDWINKEAIGGLRDWVESGGTNDPTGVFGIEGPTWYRVYANGEEEVVCPLVEKALGLLSAKRMVIGHTVVPEGRIASRCNGRVVLIDVGISAAYGGHKAALEIVGEEVRAIYPDRIEVLETVRPWGPLIEGPAGRRDFVIKIGRNAALRWWDVVNRITRNVYRF